jgi:glycosyltransferase involved in cell wall biosynthesis
MPIRVLFVTTCYPLKPGDSIPGFVADLAQALVRNGRGIEVKVVTPHHGGAAHRETVGGVEIQRFQYALDAEKQCLAAGGGIPDNLRTDPRAKWQLAGFLASMTHAVHRNLDWADVIHAHWVEPAFIAMGANLLHRRPLLVTVHSLNPRPGRLHAFTLGRADRVLFNSRYTMSQAQRMGYRCDGRVIYQGFDGSSFGVNAVGHGAAPDSSSMRGRLRVPEGVPLVTGIGRLIEVKGLHVLAQAADTILARHPEAHIVIAGYGPMQSQIEQAIARSQAKDRIHLAGTLDRRGVAQLLSESDLFVNPGVVDSNGRAEGLGITTLEAMASGLPVVASQVGGIPETMVDGVTGLLVPPGDNAALAGAIERLLGDVTLRRQMGAAGREHARRHFAWPVLAEQVAGVYREVLPSRNGTRKGQEPRANGSPQEHTRLAAPDPIRFPAMDGLTTK